MDSRTPIGSLLTLDEVRGRLAALKAELTRLERDRDVFARAFHTQVAQTVYDALVEDEVRLCALPSLDLTLDVAPVMVDAPAMTLSRNIVGGQRWSNSGRSERYEILDL